MCNLSYVSLFINAVAWCTYSQTNVFARTQSKPLQQSVLPLVKKTVDCSTTAMISRFFCFVTLVEFNPRVED